MLQSSFLMTATLQEGEFSIPQNFEFSSFKDLKD